MSALSPADRSRLAKTLALLTSDKPGEVQAAAAAANRILATANTTWSDVVAAPTTHQVPTPTWSVYRQPDPNAELPEMRRWRALVRQLLQYPGEFRSWELEFLRDLPRFQRLSVKQRYLLKVMADRVLGQDRSRRPEPPDPPDARWRLIAEELRGLGGRLSPWEREFVASLLAQPRMSERQAVILTRIAQANRVPT